MPIKVDDLVKTAASVKVYDPKFFDSSKLTGRGKKTGLLCETRNPKYIDPALTTRDEYIRVRKKKYRNGNTEVTTIPLNPIKHEIWEFMHEIAVPPIAMMKEFGSIKSSKEEYSLYLHIPPHALTLEESDDPINGGTKKNLIVCYQLMVFALPKNSPSSCLLATDVSRSYNLGMKSSVGATVYQTFTVNPIPAMVEVAKELKTKAGCTVDDTKISEYLDRDYDLYSMICARSEEWQTTIDKQMENVFANIAAEFQKLKGTTNEPARTRIEHRLESQIRYLESYNIPLDIYRNIYAYLQRAFSKDFATDLCKQNLNLLLSDTLNNLNNHKANLNTMPVNPNNTMNISWFSPEQQKALTTTEPLVLVQSGAGTGKSSTILGRIDYMIASGIKPEDITVLSFTNAAADHISEKNPNIHSMTIARMIHTIYTENFPHHELSSLDTIINSLDIYFKNDQVAIDFRYLLRDVLINEPNSFTRVNNFIENHYDDVMKFLDTMRQTSLELEIIICYQKIDSLKEPAEVTSKHLIIDEVQDNSIFEFIYSLKYVDKHSESLYIVGKQ